MIAPAFTQYSLQDSKDVLLSFTIDNSPTGVSSWCTELSSLLEERRITKAVVFVSGKTAEANPECITSFSSGIDIGSQTYNYVNLTSVADYLDALDEVKRGKEAVEKVGNIDSRVFKAPYGSTDDNIYSLLHRSGILADFSYQDHYNKYVRNQFERYEATSLSATDQTSFRLSDEASPFILEFDSSIPVDKIGEVILKFESENSDIRFVSASELTEIDLTIREEDRK
jgi:peptidoglycan/xylan/chitin deacetylase (PgdA/CDA1 family)